MKSLEDLSSATSLRNHLVQVKNLLVPTMSDSPPALVSSPASPVADSSEWMHVGPEMGEAEYVVALQKLGIQMAASIPQKLQERAVTPLSVQPECDLLIGDFKCKTKERDLFPIRTNFRMSGFRDFERI